MAQPVFPRTRKNYLSRIPSVYERRQWYRRPTDLRVRVLYFSPGIRDPNIRIVNMVDLSEGGAKLEIGPASPIPDHFFLVLGAFEFYIGSQIVERRDGFAHVCFIKELQPRFVNQISRLKDSDACLEPLGRDFKQFSEGGGV